MGPVFTEESELHTPTPAVKDPGAHRYQEAPRTWRQHDPALESLTLGCTCLHTSNPSQLLLGEHTPPPGSLGPWWAWASQRHP